MSWLDTAAGIFDFGSQAFNFGYNIFTNKRDYDYQKALQQQIFNREDTAVQRRRQDLEAAGFNPAIAAGSAASAGNVVSRSNTNDLNIGSALDTIAALQQIKNSRLENSVLKWNAEKSLEDWKMSRLNNLYTLGFDPVVAFGQDGKLHIKSDIKAHKYSESKLAQQFNYQFDYLKNSADMLQKENNWYTANQITNLVSSILPNISFSKKW